MWSFWECEPEIWIIVAIDNYVSEVAAENSGSYRQKPNSAGLLVACQVNRPLFVICCYLGRKCILYISVSLARCCVLLEAVKIAQVQVGWLSRRHKGIDGESASYVHKLPKKNKTWRCYSSNISPNLRSVCSLTRTPRHVSAQSLIYPKASLLLSVRALRVVVAGDKVSNSAFVSTPLP